MGNRSKFQKIISFATLTRQIRDLFQSIGDFALVTHQRLYADLEAFSVYLYNIYMVIFDMIVWEIFHGFRNSHIYNFNKSKKIVTLQSGK